MWSRARTPGCLGLRQGACARALAGPPVCDAWYFVGDREQDRVPLVGPLPPHGPGRRDGRKYAHAAAPGAPYFCTLVVSVLYRLSVNLCQISCPFCVIYFLNFWEKICHLFVDYFSTFGATFCLSSQTAFIRILRLEWPVSRPTFWCVFFQVCGELFRDFPGAFFT